MFSLINHLKKSSNIFKKCTVQKVGYTFEKPDHGKVLHRELSGLYSEPEEFEIHGRRFLLSESETGILLDDTADIEMKMMTLPNDSAEIAETKLLIAGGGTGGMGAFIAAKKRFGNDILLVEKAFLPGGTRTLGMVTAFWHGYRGGYCVKLLEDVKDYMKTVLDGVPCSSNVSEMLYYAFMLENG